MATRFSTIASVVVIGLSTATIGQVARAPAGQRIENGNDMADGINPVVPNASTIATDPPKASASDTADAAPRAGYG